MPDLIHAIKDHRIQLAFWWRTPRYCAAVDRLIQIKPNCERCGKPSTTALYNDSDFSQGYLHYISKVEDLTVPAGCQHCYREGLRNKRPCPRCIEEYQKNSDWQIRYISVDEKVCFAHLSKEEKIKFKHLTKIHRRINQERKKWS